MVWGRGSLMMLPRAPEMTLKQTSCVCRLLDPLADTEIPWANP